jgi:hypothetical protein
LVLEIWRDEPRQYDALAELPSRRLGFLLGAAIVAPPPHGNPLWMFVDPLRDVGLRIHDALIERHASRERKMYFFATD